MRLAARRLLPPVERQLPERHVLLGPDAGDGGADVEAAELLSHLGEEAVGLVLVPQVGLEQHVTFLGGRLRLARRARGPGGSARRRGSPRQRTRGRRRRRSRRTPRSRARACLPAPSPPTDKLTSGEKTQLAAVAGVLEASERGTAPRLGPRESGRGHRGSSRSAFPAGLRAPPLETLAPWSRRGESAPKRSARGPTSRRKRRMRAISIPSASTCWSIRASQAGFISIMRADGWLGVELRHPSPSRRWPRKARSAGPRSVSATPSPRSASRSRRSSAWSASGSSSGRRTAASLAHRGRRAPPAARAGIVARLQAAQADLAAFAEGLAGTLRVGTFQSVGARGSSRSCARSQRRGRTWPCS